MVATLFRAVKPDPAAIAFAQRVAGISALVAAIRAKLSPNPPDMREQLSEEELVIFDILTRPSPELSTDERAEVKRVARELLARLKELLVLNWRQKAAARSALRLARVNAAGEPCNEVILEFPNPISHGTDAHRRRSCISCPLAHLASCDIFRATRRPDEIQSCVNSF